jgi:hypothetical protein
VNNTQPSDSMLSLRREIEEKKIERKQEARIIRRFIFGEVTLVIIFILGIIGAHYIIDAVFANLSGIVAFFDFIFLIGLPVLFIIIGGLSQIEGVWSLKREIETL